MGSLSGDTEWNVGCGVIGVCVGGVGVLSGVIGVGSLNGDVGCGVIAVGTWMWGH